MKTIPSPQSTQAQPAKGRLGPSGYNDDSDGDDDGDYHNDDDDDDDDDGYDDDDGHLATSSPLIERIWSPGISLSTLGPPPVTNLNGDIVELSFNLYLYQPAGLRK